MSRDRDAQHVAELRHTPPTAAPRRLEQAPPRTREAPCERGRRGTAGMGRASRSLSGCPSYRARSQAGRPRTIRTGDFSLDIAPNRRQPNTPRPAPTRFFPNPLPRVRHNTRVGWCVGLPPRLLSWSVPPLCVRVSEHVGRVFRSMPATRFGGCRPGISESCRPLLAPFRNGWPACRDGADR